MNVSFANDSNALNNGSFVTVRFKVQHKQQTTRLLELKLYLRSNRVGVRVLLLVAKRHYKQTVSVVYYEYVCFKKYKIFGRKWYR